MEATTTATSSPMIEVRSSAPRSPLRQVGHWTNYRFLCVRTVLICGRSSTLQAETQRPSQRRLLTG
jgi:hypothetical protein